MKYGLSDDQLSEIIRFIEKYPEVERAILFGSRAMDTYKEASDVDIAILGDQITADLAAKIKFDLEEDTYLPFYFDIIAYPTITNEALKGHIHNKGVVIFRRGWRECRLGDVAEVVDCEHKTAPKIDKSNYYSIRTTDISNGKISFSTANRVSETTYLEWTKRATPEAGNIVLAREAPVGEVGWISPGYKVCLGQRTVLIKVKHTEVSNRFILYFLVNPDTRLELQSLSTGSVVSHLNLKDIRNFKIVLPSFREQKAIAAILSSLDDKIDLLHRQNKTLEGMAEALFREWFVEGAEDGWEESELENIIILSNGKARPKTKGIVPVYGGNGVLDYTDQNNYDGESIVIGRVGAYCGSLFFENSKIWVSDNALHAKSKNLDENYFVYYLLKTLNLNLSAEGSSHPLLTQKLINSTKILLPPKMIRKKFNDFARLFHEKINKNTNQTQILKKLRDGLLPKLMSGDVKIQCDQGPFI